MSVRLSAEVGSQSNSSYHLEEGGTGGRVPVLKLADFFEQAAQDDSQAPPLLARRRITRVISDEHLNSCRVEKRKSLEFYEEDDDTPLALVVKAKAALSSEKAPRFQLDLERVHEKQKEEGKRPDLKRTVSMGSLLSPRRGRVQSCRDRGVTTSFQEAVFSPRTVRSYVPTPLSAIEKVDISDIPDLTKGVTNFEKGVIRSMRIAWKTSDPVKVNSVEIEERVCKLCRVEIDRLFQRKDIPLSADLQITESPRAKALITLVQKSGAILFPVIKRLQIFRLAIVEYIKLKKQVSPGVRTLLSIIDNLVVQQRYSDDVANVGLIYGKDIKMFIQTWDVFSKHKAMKPFVKIIQCAFGNSKKERKEVLATLRKWVNPPHEILITLKQKVHHMDWDNISAMNITFLEHEWQEDVYSKNPISSISPREIVRCLHTGVGIPMRRLTINGHIFFDEERDENLPLPKEEDFLFSLLKNLHLAGLDRSIAEDRLREYVKKLILWKNLSLDEQASLPTSEELPCIDVLRLISNSAWGHADTYMRHLFPGLFTAPFWTKAVQSLEYKVVIVDQTDYSVQMNRTYAVYHRLVPDDENCYAVDRNRPLMFIHFSWTLTPSDEGWLGVLRVDNYEVKAGAGEYKWLILKSLIQYKDQETPKEEEKSPGTPRMRSAPRLSLKRESSSSRQMIARSTPSTSAASSSGSRSYD